MHHSFTISGRSIAWVNDAAANQSQSIRAKNRFWRARMRREAGEHENFFIAKNRDSESAQRPFSRLWWRAMRSASHRSSTVRIKKTTVAQSLSAASMIGRCGFARIIRIGASMVCRVVDERAWSAPALARQHFLKRDTVFFNVLVYSGCSAFRFPSARSD
jgi:hypothetical protein